MSSHTTMPNRALRNPPDSFGRLKNRSTVKDRFSQGGGSGITSLEESGG